MDVTCGCALCLTDALTMLNPHIFVPVVLLFTNHTINSDWFRLCTIFQHKHANAIDTQSSRCTSSIKLPIQSSANEWRLYTFLYDIKMVALYKISFIICSIMVSRWSAWIWHYCFLEKAGHFLHWFFFLLRQLVPRIKGPWDRVTIFQRQAKFSIKTNLVNRVIKLVGWCFCGTLHWALLFGWHLEPFPHIQALTKWTNYWITFKYAQLAYFPSQPSYL